MKGRGGTAGGTGRGRKGSELPAGNDNGRQAANDDGTDIKDTGLRILTGEDNGEIYFGNRFRDIKCALHPDEL